VAYFSNGSEGEGYQAAWCHDCRNYRRRTEMEDKGITGEGCPVYDLHLLLDQAAACNAEENAEGETEEIHAFVLNYLIPRDGKNGENGECRLFVPHDGADSLTLEAMNAYRRGWERGLADAGGGSGRQRQEGPNPTTLRQDLEKPE
jgi:hypothetical protein